MSPLCDDQLSMKSLFECEHMASLGLLKLSIWP
jgi:hypothetical protein